VQLGEGLKEGLGEAVKVVPSGEGKGVRQFGEGDSHWGLEECQDDTQCWRSIEQLPRSATAENLQCCSCV
jgi:hypothetical protein